MVTNSCKICRCPLSLVRLLLSVYSGGSLSSLQAIVIPFLIILREERGLVSTLAFCFYPNYFTSVLKTQEATVKSACLRPLKVKLGQC